MSGIAGIIRFDGGPVELGDLQKMTAAISYRGPDGINHWVKGSVGLGQCMMCTTAESLEEVQPLANEPESLVLVMDGWLSNWEELRAELLAAGAKLRTRADAELVLRAYETWGRDCLGHIDGDFAFVVWDASRREAFCVRDRVGNRSLVYRWDGRTFMFASEVAPILAVPGVARELNEGRVAEFLSCEFADMEETFWTGLVRLRPAHRLIVNADGPGTKEYWQPDYFATLPHKTLDDWVAHYKDVFFSSVRRCARSHKRVACEVSGGLDSSAIFSVAHDLLRNGRLPAPAVDGYTLAFYDDSEANEIEYARAVARHIGQPVDEIAPSQMPLSWFEEQAKRNSEYPGFPNGTMSLGIRRVASERGSRVSLGGDGGDQWLGGTHLYYADSVAAKDWRTFFACLRTDVEAEGLVKTLTWVLRFGCYPQLSGKARRFVRRVVGADNTGGIDARAWLLPRLRKDVEERLGRRVVEYDEQTARISQRAHSLTLKSGFSILAREIEERMAASVGLTVRRPFFTREMINFSFASPEHFRLHGTQNKYIHRLAMRGLLPEVVRTRQTKADFTVAYDWYQTELENALSSGCASIWLEPKSVANLVLSRVDGLEAHAVRLRMMWCAFACQAVSNGIRGLR